MKSESQKMVEEILSDVKRNGSLSMTLRVNKTAGTLVLSMLCDGAESSNVAKIRFIYLALELIDDAPPSIQEHFDKAADEILIALDRMAGSERLTRAERN